MTCCPACKRYIGPANVCPFCDVDIPKTLVARAMPPIAFSGSLVGLFLLWQLPIAIPVPALVVVRRLAMHVSVYFPSITSVMLPHIPWLAWALMAYLALSEPDFTLGIAPKGWRNAWHAVRPIARAVALLALSGAFGLRMADAARSAPMPEMGWLGGTLLLLIGTAIAIVSLPPLYSIRRRHLLGTLLLPLAMAG